MLTRPSRLPAVLAVAASLLHVTGAAARAAQPGPADPHRGGDVGSRDIRDGTIRLRDLHPSLRRWLAPHA